MSVYVGRWDCPTCGTRAIPGPETRCPNCHASRPPNVRFYLPDDAELLDSEEARKAAASGPDWICGHCQTQNKAIHTDCQACGNPRDELSEDVALQERQYSSEEVPVGSFAPKRTLHPSEKQPKKRKSRWGLRGVLMLAALFFGGWILLQTFPKHVQVKVVGFEWQRSIQLEHREVVKKEAWSTPNGAFEVESFKAIREYRQVLRGYEKRTRKVKVQTGTERYVCGKIDKGNGYFVDKYCTRPVYSYRTETYDEPVYDKVPVYGTKYRFKVWEWVQRPTNVIKAGGKNQEARWPEDQRLKQSKEWRAGPKKAVYYLTVQESNGQKHREKVDFAYWDKLQQGQSIGAKKAYIIGTWYGLDRR